jgi:hypothetical protein
MSYNLRENRVSSKEKEFQQKDINEKKEYIKNNLLSNTYDWINTLEFIIKSTDVFKKKHKGE